MEKATIKHLHEASNCISRMISMLEHDSDCVDIIIRSKEAQLQIHLSKKLLLENYFQKCLTEYYQGNHEEKLSEVIRVFSYR